MGSRRKDPTTAGKIDIDLVLVLVQHDGSRSGKEDERAAEGEEGCRNASGFTIVVCLWKKQQSRRHCLVSAKKRWENSYIFSASVAEGEGTEEGVDDNGLAKILPAIRDNGEEVAIAIVIEEEEVFSRLTAKRIDDWWLSFDSKGRSGIISLKENRAMRS
ncbi:hypothetical protein BHE74_00013645 [Ensete ventricosum]|nr:hypothetical protein BHE74_00013645 [Ensete ventricosum]